MKIGECLRPRIQGRAMKRLRCRLSAVVLFLAAVPLPVTARGGREPAETEPAVHLTYMTWDYPDRRDFTDAFLKGARESLGILIELQNVPTDQYQSVLKTRIASGDAPDLISLHSVLSGYGADIARTGQLRDISHLSILEHYDPTVLDANRLAGKL
jgi:ABC-type glycerol-3-phosphate transport system substrate-binding protein